MKKIMGIGPKKRKKLFIICAAIIAFITAGLAIHHYTSKNNSEPIADETRGTIMANAQMIVRSVEVNCQAMAIANKLAGKEDICADGVSIAEVSKLVVLVDDAKIVSISYADGKVKNLST